MKQPKQPPRRTRVRVPYTFGDRIALALWLATPWGGTLEQLEGLFEISEAFETGKVKVVQGPQGLATDVPTDAKITDRHEAELSQATVRMLLELFPRQPTPAELGPHKVRLLRALKAALPPAPAPPPQGDAAA